MPKDIDFAYMPIKNRLPNCMYAKSAPPDDKFPDDLIGAGIIAVGKPRDIDWNDGIEGGLVIDYRPNGSDCVKRIVLGFTDLGMWVEWNGDKK